MKDNVSGLKFDDHCRFCKNPVDHEISVGAGYSVSGLAASHPECIKKLTHEEYVALLHETRNMGKHGRVCPCGIFRGDCIYHK